MKKIISLLLCALLLASAVLSGCSGDVMDSRKAEASKDKYRNFYEIFTQSYCDSDGDAIGDLHPTTSTTLRITTTSTPPSARSKPSTPSSGSATSAESS